MTTVSYTDASGAQRTIEAESGSNVMKLATQNGVPGIIGECGGMLSCATCHVFVDETDLDMVGAPSDLEDEMLEGTAVDREPNSRLGCQLHPCDYPRDLHVTTPESQY